MRILSDSLTYPVRGAGKYLLVIGAVLSIMVDIVSLAPLLGILAGIFLFGYLCAIYFQIIQSSAVGDAEAPQVPDTANLIEDILLPAAQVLGVTLLSFAPFIAASLLAGAWPAGDWIIIGTFLLGAIYAPMALLAVAVLGHMGAVHPGLVLPSVYRAGWCYAWVVTALLLLYVLLGILMSATSHLFIVSHLVAALAGIYVMMANGRLVGLIYREREEQLDWF